MVFLPAVDQFDKGSEDKQTFSHVCILTHALTSNTATQDGNQNVCVRKLPSALTIVSTLHRGILGNERAVSILPSRGRLDQDHSSEDLHSLMTACLDSSRPSLRRGVSV